MTNKKHFVSLRFKIKVSKYILKKDVCMDVGFLSKKKKKKPIVLYELGKMLCNWYWTKTRGKSLKVLHDS